MHLMNDNIAENEFNDQPADLLFQQFPGKVYPAFNSTQGFMQVIRNFIIFITIKV